MTPKDLKIYNYKNKVVSESRVMPVGFSKLICCELNKSKFMDLKIYPEFYYVIFIYIYD